MGFFTSSSSSTQSANAAELSSKGQEYEDLFNVGLVELYSQMGYEIKTETKEAYKDEKKARVIQSKIDSATSKIESIESQLSDKNLKLENPIQYEKLLSQKSMFERELSRETENLARQDKETYTDFTTTKLEDVRVRNAIDKYGPDSKQVSEARNKVKAEEVFQADIKAEVSKNYLTALNKFTKGDFSYTEEQAKQAEALVAPVRKTLLKTTEDLLSKFKDDYSLMTEELDKVGKSIDQTKFDTLSALSAAEVQIEKSGETLMATLEKVNSSAEERARFQFDLLSSEADKKIDAQNAMLGLPPTSQVVQLQKAKVKGDLLKSIELEMAANEAKGAMQIQSGVESGKQQISLQKVLLEQQTGDKKESMSKYGVDLLGSYLGKEEATISAKNQALLGIEKTKSEQLYNASTGGLASILSAGQSGLSFDNTQKGQEQGLMSNVMGQAGQPLSFEKNLQMYEGTTKSNTTSTPSGFDILTDVGGAAIGAYGGAKGWWG